MQIFPHELRMLNEHAELQEKIESLKCFIGNLKVEPYKSLHIEEKRLLTAQLNYMVGYRGILKTRIDRTFKRTQL